MLDVVIYQRQTFRPCRELTLFSHGLRRHGIQFEERSELTPRRCDLAVFWAHKARRVIDTQRSAGNDYLVLERGYFGDRFAMTSIGYNGLNGHADFHNRNSPADRWRQYGVSVREWKTDGSMIVLMGQVPTDASLRDCPNYRAWVESAARQARCFYNTPVHFRPHPHPVARTFRPNLPIIDGSLEDALNHAMAVLIWNSNSGVDAILHGVPLIACDRGSMAYPMGVRIGESLIRPDRTQWLNDLAYAQWSDRELENGEAWSHLRQRYASRTTAA